MSTWWRGQPARGGRQAVYRPGFSPVLEPGIRETASAGRIRQTVPASNGRGLRASIWPDSRVVGHEHPNAVKHVFQARFELPLPPVLGEARR